MIMTKAAYTDIGDVIGDVVKLIGDIIDIMDQLIRREINMDPITATIAKVVIGAVASAIIDSISNSQKGGRNHGSGYDYHWRYYEQVLGFINVC